LAWVRAGTHIGSVAVAIFATTFDVKVRKRRMKVMATNLVAVLLLALIPAVAHAQDFAADVVYIATTKPNAPASGTTTPPGHSSKVYVTKNKMRLETRGVTGTILLVNGDEHSVIALFPAQKAYQQLASAPSEYFRVQDAENACPDWEKASSQKILCDKVGPDAVNGRPAVKYQNKAAANDGTNAVWIDAALKFVIKWEGPSTGAELRNITEAPQAADLFTVPSAYDVLRPQKASKGFSKRAR
jgi:hypothetical protein